QARPCNVYPVIEIDLAPAIRAWIDLEAERPLRHLFGALHKRLAGQDRPGADEDRKFRKLVLARQLALANWLAGPVIVPAPSRQANVEWIRGFRRRRPRHEDG